MEIVSCVRKYNFNFNKAPPLKVNLTFYQLKINSRTLIKAFYCTYFITEAEMKLFIIYIYTGGLRTNRVQNIANYINKSSKC